MTDPHKLAVLRSILTASESRATKINKANDEYQQALRSELDALLGKLTITLPTQLEEASSSEREPS